MNNNAFKFKKAVPVWKKGDQLTMNQTLEFNCDFDGREGTLYIAGCSSYLVFVNNEFVAHGPARAAKGFYKVDALVLDKFLQDGKNRLTIRASGYNVNSFSYIDMPSFVCAELIKNGEVVFATGDNFSAQIYNKRIVKVPKYSYQRTFCEAYDLNKENESVEIERVCDKTFILRDVHYFEYDSLYPAFCYNKGEIGISKKEDYFNNRALNLSGTKLKGYAKNETEYNPHIEYGKLDFLKEQAINEKADIIEIEKDSFKDVVFDKNSCGLIAFEVESEADATVFVSFDEMLVENKLNPFRLSAINIITIKTNGKAVQIVTAEPYVMKYMRITALGSAVKIKNLRLIEIAFPRSLIISEYKNNDKDLVQIYNAALHTFRTNVADIYMDCASRERAGWLGDSFFIGRAERYFTGGSVTERAFLRNYLLPKEFDDLPKGMIPMCYPSNVLQGEFIPNFAMWFTVHLYDYYTHTLDQEIKDLAKERLYSLVDYFKGFENEYGLLENLENWVFVEWSKANDFVQDVSFPSNMLYSAFKSIVGNLYNDAELLNQAEALRKTIVSMSELENGFFCDNAVRKNGKLVLSGESSEVCQYYAFWTKCATPDTHNKLWQTLLSDFNFKEQKEKKHPKVYPANVFMGSFMRLSLLEEFGFYKEIENNIKEYYLPMAKLTGSLWEHFSPHASCSHGFCSYLAYLLDKTNKR